MPLEHREKYNLYESESISFKDLNFSDIKEIIEDYIKRLYQKILYIKRNSGPRYRLPYYS